MTRRVWRLGPRSASGRWERAEPRGAFDVSAVLCLPEGLKMGVEGKTCRPLAGLTLMVASLWQHLQADA